MMTAPTCTPHVPSFLRCQQKELDDTSHWAETVRAAGVISYRADTCNALQCHPADGRGVV